MHAQISSVTLKPGKVDEWLALTRDSILPAAKEQAGFVNAMIFVDREKQTGLGISLWQSERHADAVAESGFYREQVAKAADYLVSVDRQVMELAVQL